MKQLSIVVVLAAGAWLSACRPIKKIQTVVSKPVDTTATVSMADPRIDSALVINSILERIATNKIDFNTFFGQIKLDFTDLAGKNTKANVYVRIKKDSVIWLSVTAPVLDLEFFRILVKPDTVLIMDKQKRTIAVRTVEYLQDFVKIPIDFFTLQDLLMGNVVFFDNRIVSYRYNNADLLALNVGSYFKHLITMDSTTGRISNSKLDDVQELRNRTCNIQLSDYALIQNRNFSQSREISVTEKAKIDIILNFKKVEFDTPQKFSFNVPKNYTSK
ncbi:MAG: DUF4292 domain-containing protein [Bacteroidetes bacterium]|nr:MAG: DUF4292 domain-containing protein [Bacteroidota bacterium]